MKTKLTIDGSEIKFRNIVIEKGKNTCDIYISMAAEDLKALLQSKAGVYTQIYTNSSESIGARSSISLSSAIAAHITGTRYVELNLPDKTIIMPAASVTMDVKELTEKWSATAQADAVFEIKAWRIN